MHPDDIQAMKDYANTNLSDYKEALDKVNAQIIDLLVEARGGTGNYNRIVKNATSDELYKFAKAMEDMADCLKLVERDQRDFKKAGLPIETL